MINYKGADIRTFNNKLGYIANISHGKHIAIPLGYNKGYTEQEVIEKAKDNINQIIKL